MNQNFLNDCPETLREFLSYMQTIKGRSEKTVDAYYIDLKTFYRFLKCKFMLKISPFSLDLEHFKELTIADVPIEIVTSIKISDVYEYLAFAMDALKNKAHARSRKVSALRSFYKYLTTKTNLLEINPVKDLEVPSLKKSLPVYLSLEESLEFLASIDRVKYPRDYCMITLFLNCGMRVSELVGINTTDISGETLRLLGKGNKERIIYLNAACLSVISDWLAQKPVSQVPKDRYALFVGSNGARLSVRRVQQLIEMHLKNAGLENRGFSPHKLRHTAATLMYQNGGADIRILKEILGHANLATTEIYTHVSNEQVKKAMLRSPLSKAEEKKSEPKKPENLSD